MIGGGLPRTPNLADRRATPRSAQVQRSPEEAQQVAGFEQPRASQSPAQPPVARRDNHTEYRKPSGGKKVLWVILVTILVATICAVVWFVLQKDNKSIAGQEIDPSKYQTVFFVNGQEYFGNLEIIDSNYVKLTNVFYVRSNSETETPVEGDEDGQVVEGAGTASNSQLIKLGDEINGPEDAMIINRDQVLFFVNMKPNAQVSKLIDQYKAGGN